MPSRSTVARGAALLVGLPLLALALVVLADAVPDRFVLYRLRDAIEAGQIEERSYRTGYAGGQLDGFSECKRMTVGLGAPPGMGPVESAVRSPTLGRCETAVPKVLGWTAGDGLTRSYDYFRYWNGSTVVLRPAVAAFGVGGTRILAAMVLAAAALAWWWAASRRIGALAPGLALVPLVWSTDFVDLPGALVHAVGMTVALASAAALSWGLRPTAAPSGFAAAGFAAGAAFQFFGDLTNPDAAWALVTASSALAALGAPRLRNAVVRVLAAGSGWIAGFAWIWFSKWVIAAAVIGYDTVRSVVDESAEQRLAGPVDGRDVDLVVGVSSAWEAWRSQPLMAVTTATLFVLSAVIVVRRRDLGATWTQRLLIAGPAAIPVVWHAVMRNHTAVHAWFTYRSFAVAFGIVVMATTARLVVPVGRLDTSEPGAVDPVRSADADATGNATGQAENGSTASGSMS